MSLLKALVLSLIILSGCVSEQPSSAPLQNATPPAIAQNASPQPSAPPQNGAATAQPAPQSPYAGMDFASLAALGAPLQCDITYTYQGTHFQAKVYMRGVGELRVENAGGSGLSQCGTTITVIQADKAYVGCQNKTVLPSCDWFSSSYNPQVPGQSSTFDFTKTPPSQISCSDWEYDPSLFLAPGRVCRLGG